MKSRTVFWILLLLAGCYRADTRRLVVTLPETAGNPAELEAVKQHLFEEQSRLKNGIVFYDEIDVDAANASLIITYHRDYLADMNVLGKINALGYRVNDLPGDPALLAATRKKMARP